MTSFANMPDREAHWKAFGADPEWKKLGPARIPKQRVAHRHRVFAPYPYSGL
ncbi:MAG: hypothetical protein WKG07_47185 [Hymenobacter sp.]